MLAGFFHHYRALASRYRTVIAETWRSRHLLDVPPRRSDELAFLPAELELLETPLNPLPVWSARLILALVIFILLWSCLGKVDIVAEARGKVIQSGRTKSIQAPYNAILSAIHVQDGLQVKTGQLLLQLDPVNADADHRHTEQTLQQARLSALRFQALLHALDQNTPPLLEKMADVSPAQQQAEAKLARSQWQSYQARLAALRCAAGQYSSSSGGSHQLATSAAKNKAAHGLGG